MFLPSAYMIFVLLTASCFLLVFILCPSLCILQTFSDLCKNQSKRVWSVLETPNFNRKSSKHSLFSKSPVCWGKACSWCKMKNINVASSWNWPKWSLELWLCTWNKDSWLSCATALSKSHTLGMSNLTALPHSLLETLAVWLGWQTAPFAC